MEAVAGRLYAQIVNGRIHWVFGSTDLPQWADGQIVVADITNVSPAPQVGWTATETGGVWAFSAPVAPPAPTLAQQALALLATGLTIASTGTPAVNGVYGCDPETRATIAEVVAGISAGDGFPGGGTTFDFLLANGSVVEFPATTVFMAAAKAVRDFVYGCLQVVNGRSATLPSASVTIA